MERDRLELTTPEGVTLDLELAGVGTRSLAGFLDLLIQGLIGFVLTMIVLAPSRGSGWTGFVLFALGTVALLAGYHVYFEVRAGGQTPGKRALGIRVVRADGGPLRLSHSLIRTLMRIVDYLPWWYIIGLISVFTSTRNQRLGDMAAGTVVVYDRSRSSRSRRESIRSIEPVPMESILRARTPAVVPDAGGWDVSQITAEEYAVVRRFLDRRWSLATEQRHALATQLADRLRPKVVTPPEPLGPEAFLIRLAEVKGSATR